MLQRRQDCSAEHTSYTREEFTPWNPWELNLSRQEEGHLRTWQLGAVGDVLRVLKEVLLDGRWSVGHPHWCCWRRL